MTPACSIRSWKRRSRNMQQQPARQHLAQLNIGRLRYEANDSRMADFVDNLALVNGLAERSDGLCLALPGRQRKRHRHATVRRRSAHGHQYVGVDRRRRFRALCLADRAQAILRAAGGMVREVGRGLLRDVVGARGSSADGARSDRAARSSQSSWPERSCLRVGKRAGGANGGRSRVARERSGSESSMADEPDNLVLRLLRDIRVNAGDPRR